MGSTLGGIVAVRKLLGKEPTVSQEPSKGAKKASGSPFSDEQWKFCYIAAFATGILTVMAHRFQWNESFSSPLQMLFLLSFTVGAYTGATRLPAAFNKVVHPLVTSSAAVLLAVRALAAAEGRDFLDILRSYKVGSLDPLRCGAGDYLIYALSPAVVSFSISVYSRRSLLFNNLPIVLTAMIISSAGGLFATGAFVRLISLGGQTGNSALVRLSVLARNVTTALAMALTDMVGGDIAIISAVVCLTGILGASYGVPLLNLLGIKDPICRGLGIGSSSIGLGVAAMANEADAFPFASVAMVLTAVSATTLASIPSVRNALIQVTTGPAPAF